MSNLNELNFRMPWSKRIFDLVVACYALLFLLPILLLAIIAIVIESKGKVFYTSKRIGRGLDVFDLYKFRSMYVGADAKSDKLAKNQNQNAPENMVTAVDFSLPCPRCAVRTDGSPCSELHNIDLHEICDYWYNFQMSEINKTKLAFINIANDPRITRVGKFLRQTGIDNIPQLFNVIKGDMSIVGNRPLPVYEAELLTSGVTAMRFLAPAGITGLWQVEQKAFNGLIPEKQRMQLDNEYASHFAGDNYSFFYDLKLIIRTVLG